MSNELTPTTNYITTSTTTAFTTPAEATAPTRRRRQGDGETTAAATRGGPTDGATARGARTPRLEIPGNPDAPKRLCTRAPRSAPVHAQGPSLPPLRRQGPLSWGKSGWRIRYVQRHFIRTHLNLSVKVPNEIPGTPELTFKSLA